MVPGSFPSAEFSTCATQVLSMSSFLLLSPLLLLSVNGCSIPPAPAGHYYISNVQLLDVVPFPDKVLLTIARTAADPPYWVTLKDPAPTPRMSFVSDGPWCKLMNVHDGTVSATVPCDDYQSLIRPYSEPMVDPKNTKVVSCYDNCDGSSATCEISRGGITFTIGSIPYYASSTLCTPPALGTVISEPPLAANMDLFSSFTLSDAATTYIGFATNMVAVEFDDAVYPPTVTLYDVERDGDVTDWSYLTPGQFGYFGSGMTTGSLAVYESNGHNVMSIPLPCCLCYSRRLSAYSIVKDEATRTQVFTLSSLGFGGGSVDGAMGRVLNWGLFYSDSLKLFDLGGTDLLNSASFLKEFEPDLCDVVASCAVSPCSVATECGYNPTAVCVDDYCGMLWVEMLCLSMNASLRLSIWNILMHYACSLSLSIRWMQCPMDVRDDGYYGTM